MGISIPGKDSLYVETRPRFLPQQDSTRLDVLKSMAKATLRNQSDFKFSTEFCPHGQTVGFWCVCFDKKRLKGLHCIMEPLPSYFHYNDVIMGMIVSQITSLTIVYSTVHSGADQRKHQSSASMAFVPVPSNFRGVKIWYLSLIQIIVWGLSCWHKSAWVRQWLGNASLSKPMMS